MRQLILTVITLLLATLVMDAQPSNQTDKLRNEALDLFDSKQFVEAYPLYSQLVSLFPQDGDLNFRFGVCTLHAGESKEDAIKHLNFAKKKKVDDPRLHYYLGKAYHLNYEFDLAIVSYNKYLEKRDPKNKDVLPAEQGITMCSQGKNLLTNIKDVVVLNKTSTDVEAFFRFYNLEEIGGKILAIPEDLKTKFDKKQNYNGVLYRNSNSSTVYYSSYGKDGKTGLDIYKTYILPDGSFANPDKLGSEINTDQDEEFAYMHPDGTSFYFASKGHNSMGGYDIFKSNFNGAMFTSPQNMDFAINTPDDDLFFVTDSAHRTAYFASARSSKQGELHVYKVMVDGIPIQLMFVQGVFANEVKSNEQKARLKIIDELSGKTIIDTYTDQIKGDYLLSFPKAGRYKLELQVQGNSVIHEGVIELPSFDHPVALRQELKLINDGGRDQLIIENYFETELDVNLAELSANALKQKASLEVNATVELIAKAEEQGTISTEVKIDEAHMAAGFNEDKPVDVILSEMSTKRAENDKKINQLNAMASMAFAQADSLYNEAKKKTNKAESLLSNADKSDQNSYMSALKEYNDLLIDSQDDQMKSEDLFQSVILLNTAQEAHAQKSRELESATKNIQEAYDNENTESLVSLLQSEKERRRSTFDPLEEIISSEYEKSLSVEKDVQNFEDRLVSLRADEKQLAASIERNKVNIEQVTKKNVKIQLQEELAQEEGELLYVENEIIKADKYISKQSIVGVQHNNRSQILSGLAETDASFESAEAIEADQINSRLAQLSNEQKRNNVLMLDNSEALASISDDTKQTRNDIVRLENIKSASISTGIDWKDLKDIQSNHQKNIALLANSSEGKSLKERVILEQTEEEVFEQLRLLQTAEKIEASEDLSQAIVDLQAYQSELQSEKIAIAAPAASSEIKLSNESLVQRVNSVSEVSDPFTFAMESQKVQSELLNLKLSNQEQILQSNNPDEIEKLSAENDWIEKNWADLESKNTSAQASIELSFDEKKEDLLKSNLPQEERIDGLMNLSNDMIVYLETKEENEGLSPDEQQRLSQERVQFESYSEDLLMLVSVSEPDASITTVDVLPAEELAIINEIYPNYNQEFDQVNNGEYSQQQDQVEEQLALNSALANVTQTKIDERVEAIDSSSEEEEKERLQLEITKLQSIINRTANERLLLAERKNEIEKENAQTETSAPEAALVEIESTVSSESPSSNTALKQRKELFNEVQSLLSDEQVTSVNDAYEHSEFATIEGLIEDDRFNKDVEKVRLKSAEIATFEAEMELEDSESKKKKIDKKIEKAFYDRSSSEIRISKQTADVSKEIYEANLLAIDLLKNDNAVSISENPGLQTRIDEVDAETAEAFEEAEEIRNAAAPEIDEIKQADSFKQAALIEMQALEQQKEVIALLSKSDQINTLTEEERTALFAFENFPAETELVAAEVENDAAKLNGTSNNGVPEELIENAVSNTSSPNAALDSEIENDVALSTETDVSPNPSETTTGPTETAENEVSVAEDDSIAAELVEIENEILAEFELPAELNLSKSVVINETDFVEEKEIDSEEFERVKASVAYAEIDELEEEIKVLDASKLSSMERRTALVDQMQSERAKLINLSQAVNQSTSVAEKEGLNIEIENLRSKAKVNYETLAEIDNEIESKNSELNDAIEKRNNFLINLDVAEIIADGNREEVSSTPEVSTIALPEAISPELAEAKSKGYFFANETKSESFNFSFPEELKEEIFSIVNESPYSEGQPIPVGLEMPKGVVYKVQVGAFRNSIPQNLYGNFTPISGELTNSGLTRYTVGLFKAFATADLAKTEVHTMGYQDAFVVAYRDGVRIPLYEARNETDAGIDLESIAQAKEEIKTRAESQNTTANNQNLAETIDSRELTESNTAATPTVSNALESENTASEENAAAIAIDQDWSQQQGSYYTVQVGVFSKPVTAAELGLNGKLMVEKLDNGYYRYSSGKYENVTSARGHQRETRSNGVEDAFITAYKNGKRVAVSSISASEAQNETQDVAPNAAEPEVVSEPTATAAPAGVYRVVIGTYNGEVPSKTAIMMLQLEAEYGIVQEITNQGTRYVSKKVNSQDEAQKIADAFAEGGVQIETIQKLPE